MKNKKWLVVLIIAFPSFFWLILETSTINSKKLPFYGPKQVIAKGDTVFHKVSDRFYQKSNTDSTQLVPTRIPDALYAIVFINSNYRSDSYRLAGLWEYLNYKKTKIEHIPFVLVTRSENGSSPAYTELSYLEKHSNVRFLRYNKAGFDSISKSYFAGKPYYVDYSFFVLVDADRHVRGYYDARYVSEIKRLIDEYQHLRLKEEKQKLIENNEINKNNS